MTPSKILIVEDEALVVASLQQILTANNYAVLPPVATGESALKTVSELRPDLVIMDIELLNGMNGTEVAGRIRESFDIPIIYMTAYSNDGLLEQAKLSEPYGYLVKPVETRDLLIAIRLALYKHAMDRKLRESEERHRIVADFTADWEYWVAPDGTLLYVSPSCERITGYSPQEFLEKPNLIETILHSDDRSLFDRHREEAQNDRDSPAIREIEFRIVKKNGKAGWLGHVCRNVFREDGTYLGTRVSNRDITGRKQTEQALKKSQALLAESERIAGWGSWEFDVVSGTSHISKGLKCLSGLPPDYPLDVPYQPATSELVHPDDAAMFFSNMDRTIREGVPWNCEYRIIRKDNGQVRYRRSRGEARRDETGRVIRVIGADVDITERKQAEESIRDLLRFNQNVLDALTAHICVLDQDGKILAVNRAWRDFIAANPPPAIHADIGADYFAVCESATGDDAAIAKEVLRGLRAVMRGELLEFSFEYPCHSPDIRRWFLLRATPIHYDTARVVIAHENITERKLAEAAVAESERKFREMAELLPEPLFECDVAGNLTYANQSAFQKFRYRVDDLAGGLNIYQMIVPEEFERAKQNLAASLAVGQGMDGREYTARRKDGTTFPVLVYAATTSQKGRIAGLRGIMVDISELKRAEQERRTMHEQLIQSQKMEAVGQLAGGIAHDFNNTLGSIIGYAELVMARVAKDDADSKHYLLGINSAANRSRALIQQLLTFCRKQPSLEQDYVLTSVIQESLTLIRTVLPPGIRLSLSLPDEPLMVRGDGLQLQQALLNLCNNAIYAMKGRGGALGVDLSVCEILADEAARRYSDLTPGRYAKLIVSDDGVGIPGENLGKIFEPFFTTKMLGEGTGLGLAVVYGVVKRHRGRVDVESVVGQGTTFILLLPLVSTPAEYPRENAPVKTLPKGNGELVLVVDDDATMANTVVQRLELLNYRAEVCHNGQSALERIRKESDRYDAIITDQMMPFMMGSDLIQRAHEVRPELPFILYTGYTDRLSPENAADIGASAYLEKPVTMKLLAETLRGILRVAKDGHG